MKHTLEVDSVIKYYDNKMIVSDVYLHLETHEILGLLGRNGSGKSTLLKIIFGLIGAETKFIRIDNTVKFNESFTEISYLNQDSFIPQNFTVRKAISLSIQKDRINLFHNDTLLKPILNNKIGELSGGELRYLEIKLILEKESKFVLLDEPYNGLSPIMIEEINKIIVEASARKGIIITDHNYENVIKISTKLILMKDGKTHQINKISELVDKGYLSHHFIND